MPPESSSRRRTLLIVGLLLLALALVLLVRCKRTPAVAEPGPAATAPTQASPQPQEPAANAPASAPREAGAEVLGEATVKAPAEVAAGAAFAVSWTGPDNEQDFVTIVPKAAPADSYKSYQDTRRGPTATLTAAMEPGDYEVRYVTGKSRTVLARSAVRVLPVAASLEAPASAVLGSVVPVAWTGPNNEGDYVTIVMHGTPDGTYAKYSDTKNGPRLEVTAPAETGQAEIRYVSGQGAKVLARRPLTLLAPEVSLEAAAEAVAGSEVQVTWVGPKNAGDYITVVPKSLPEGQYAGYADADRGSPVGITVPIDPGPCEIRYVSGQGAKTLKRRDLTVAAARITLEAAGTARVGQPVEITWTGPNNSGDYVTIVPRDAAADVYQDYADTRRGSPVSIKATKQAGPAEIRYISGQGRRILARRDLAVEP